MVVVGVDVSKGSLDACALVEGQKPLYLKVDNNAKGFAQILSWAVRLSNGCCRFCMESTGGYEFEFACFLAEKSQRVCVENPRVIKHFGAAAKCLNKTDRADARCIALYAQKMDPRPWALADKTKRELALLNRHRENLVEEQNRVSNRLMRPGALPLVLKQMLTEQRAFLKRQVDELEKEMERLVRSSENIHAEVKALRGLCGLGPVGSIAVLCEMPDVELFDSAEHWTSNAGMFPRRCESGLWRGQSRMSKAGNAHVRRALYMGVTQAKRLQPNIRALANRLKERGLAPKQIRVACMRKILLMAYGILKRVKAGLTPFYGLPIQEVALA